MARKRRKVNLTEISDPRGITLTKSPANLSGFKIVRSGETLETRGDLRAIVLPPEADKDFAGKVLSAYDLGDDFSLHEADSHKYLAINGFSTDEVVIPVNIGFGLTALISEEALAKSTPRSPVARSENEIDFKKPTHPELAALRFSKQDFNSAKQVQRWASDNAIDTEGVVVEKSDTDFCVLRFCKQENTTSVDLGDGVSAEIYGKAGGKIPSSIYRSVVHKTFGYNSMWDSLDFASMAANPAYIESNESSIDVLSSVLQNIMLHSELSVEDKKAAVSAAVNSYESYTLNLLNSLPEPAFPIETSLNTSSTETDSMSKEPEAKQEEATEVEQVTRSAEETETAEQTETPQMADTITVSTSELKDLIRDCLISVKADAAVEEPKAEGEEQAQRSDPLDAISEAIKKMAETTEALSQRMVSVEDLVKQDQDSVTVARSAEDDTEQQPQEPNSVFRGAFGNFGASAI